ncbi:hypothetical protein V5O48_019066 [Marasmius crinis-equi]|uniref:Uncharacterized protein n=1 Tax=Marasmius crinis-equi TaxID=585013 RepID=A0ABR3EJF2_9AGAR
MDGSNDNDSDIMDVADSDGGPLVREAKPKGKGKGRLRATRKSLRLLSPSPAAEPNQVVEIQDSDTEDEGTTAEAPLVNYWDEARSFSLLSVTD